MPQVSFMIPTYNRAHRLFETIDSALNQTYQDFEIIVVDDGSTDNTKELMEGYQKKHPGKVIKYFCQSNQGPGAARNLGIQKATGEYMAFIDSDDYFMPEFLEKCMERCVRDKFDVVTPQCYTREVIGSDGSRSQFKVIREPLSDDPVQVRRAILEKHVGSQTMLLKRSCFDTIGLYDTQCYIEDWDVWIRLACHDFKIGFAPGTEPLWVYRVESTSRWNSEKNEARRLVAHYDLYKKHKKAAYTKDLASRKIYAAHLWNTGKGLMKLKGKKILGMSALVESQFYDFSLSRINELFRKAASKIATGDVK